jgi:DNA-directed RNA polymerase specialized sigma24 family protein
MSKELESLPIEVVGNQCSQESELFRSEQRRNQPHCFELFRRAIALGDEKAWSLIFSVYQRQIERWVGRHPSFPNCAEEVQYFVNRALERFWRALTPQKFSDFREISMLLEYLKLCVNGAILDHVRTLERKKIAESDDIESIAANTSEPLGEKIEVEETWKSLIISLEDEREIIVLECAYVFDMPARQILAQNPQHFSEVREIYRIKENILRRLRRNPPFQNI